MRSPDGRRDHRYCHRNRRPGVRLRAATFLLAVTGATGCGGLPTHETLPSLSAADPAFAATMEAYTNSPVIGGNVIDVLVNGDAIFPAKLAAIRAARTTINYAEYFYAEGQIAQEIAQALAERCRAGVTANILLDGFGTLSMASEHAEMLKAAGCRTITFRPLGRFSLRRHNNRNHRRILVVDGRVGITGGSGVSAKWTGDGKMDGHWRDTDVRIEGPAVRALQGAFVENWREATGELLGGEAYFPEPLRPRGDFRAQVVRSSPAIGSYAMYTMYLLAISSARREIYLTNPYFLPDERMEAALLAAVRRGVRVVALTPGKIDHNVVRSASRRGFGRLLEGGIAIFEYQAALLHAKTMVVDGTWATIGSTNFDNRSFAVNDELNLAVYDTPLAGRIAKSFEEDLAHATRVTYESWKNRGLKAKLLEVFVFPLESQL
jgi:cardiolipin synthase